MLSMYKYNNQSESFSGCVSLTLEIWKNKIDTKSPSWQVLFWMRACANEISWNEKACVRESAVICMIELLRKARARRSWCLGLELEWKGFLARLVHESSLRQLQWAASVISSSSDRTPPPPWRTSILLNLGFKWWMSWKSLHPIAES